MGWNSHWNTDPDTSIPSAGNKSTERIKNTSEERNKDTRSSSLSLGEFLGVSRHIEQEDFYRAILAVLRDAGLLDKISQIEDLKRASEDTRNKVSEKLDKKDFSEHRAGLDGKYLTARTVVPVVSMFLVIVIPLICYIYLSNESQKSKQLQVLASEVKEVRQEVQKIPREAEIKQIIAEEQSRANK